jgi:5-methylcytosine-specific restriction endonuclease McrA
MPTNTTPHYMNNYYKKHKDKWLNPEETHKRVERNKARAAFAKKLGVSPKQLNGDVDHKKPLRDGGKSTLSNLRLTTEKKNRGWRKGEK